MTEFVAQHATVVANPRYHTKKLAEIEYFTGTRVYRVHTIRNHIPCLLSLFGRQIKCIYTGQPEQQPTPERHDYSNTNSDKSDTENTSDEQSDTTYESENETETTYSHKSNRKNNHNNSSDKSQNKKRPAKMTITTENLIEYNPTQEKRNEHPIKHIQNNTKRQVNKHLPNNQNITQRKKQ